MSIRFIDGFDSYSASSILYKYNNTGGTLSMSSSNGRFGGSAIQMDANGILYKYIDNQSTWIVGFALKTTMPTDKCRLITFADNDVNKAQCEIFLNSAGSFSIWSGHGSSLQASSSGIFISANTWYYIEAKVGIHNTAGTCVLNVNGATYMNATNINTRASTTNNYANGIYLGNGGWGGAGGMTQYYDDYYISDANGTSNTFLGDVRVATILPSGNGFYSQFARQGGLAGNNYLSVNESSVDSDSTYVETSGIGNTDSYQYTDLPTVASSIKCIQFAPCVRKTDAGIRQLGNIVRIGSTDYVVTSGNILDSYQYNTSISEINPSTGSSWTNSDINNLEAGIKLLS